MKLLCSKCSKPLTMDMYMVPYKDYLSKRVWDKEVYVEKWEDCDGEVYENEKVIYTFKRGVFFISPRERKYSWTYKDVDGVDSKKEYVADYGDDGSQHYHRVLGGKPATIVCSSSSVLDGVIPKFKKGYGCCNYSTGHTLLCECGSELGGMYLDCYEDNTICFIDKSVVRCYK